MDLKKRLNYIFNHSESPKLPSYSEAWINEAPVDIILLWLNGCYAPDSSSHAVITVV